MRSICHIDIPPSMAAAFVLMFVTLVPFAPAQSTTTIVNNGDPANRVDIAVLGDGYASADMNKYAKDVQTAVNGFFTQQPFREYQDYFNVHRVDVVSQDSGVSHPELRPPVTKNTALGAYYNCDGIERLICVDYSKLTTTLSKALTSTKRDIILVIVNDSTYGGSGGSYAVISTDPAMIEVLLHEEGHTLGLLGDEYGGPPPPYCDMSVEPSEPNITMKTNRSQIKWNYWIDEATGIPTYSTSAGVPGLYRGAQYCDSGKYRPTYNSKMRNLNVPFEQVNTEQLIKRIYNFVSPMDAASPSSTSVTVPQGDRQDFSVTTPNPLYHNLSFSWTIDGKAAGTSSRLTVDSGSLTVGTHTVAVAIEDKTDMVRNDPNKVMRETQSWTLRVQESSALNLTLNAGGAAIASTAGGDGPLQIGYAKVAVTSYFSAPYGTAVFSFKQGGVTVAETGVPSSPPTTSARVFIDYRPDAVAVPGRDESGRVRVNTGIAVVNPNTLTATVTYTLRDENLNIVASGQGTIEAGHHISGFIDELDDKGVSGFDFPDNFAGSSFGILDIESSRSVSVLALRGTLNQENNFLITTTPVADLNQGRGYGNLYFPHFVDGGGYTTSLVLVNTSQSTETGRLLIRDRDGNDLFVSQVGGEQDSSFPYSIPPGGFFRFQADGSSMDVRNGWVQLIPDFGSQTPSGTGVFSYNPENVLISESGIPSSDATTHARIYVDLTGTYNTGLAIANVSGSTSSITINAFQNDGVTPAGTSLGPLVLPADGYDAEFAGQLVSGLPEGFTGVLDIRSQNSFAALTVRSMTNELNRFLMATFPVADANKFAPSQIVFPQIADGGGYTSQIILISPSRESNATLRFYGEDGAVIDLNP